MTPITIEWKTSADCRKGSGLRRYLAWLPVASRAVGVFRAFLLSLRLPEACDVDRVSDVERNEEAAPAVDFNEGTWVRHRVNKEIGRVIKLNEGDSTLVKWLSDWKTQNVKNENLMEVK